ncbi:hypothetical protein Trydic_g4859 [Trypoxylus dichotomus]
MDPESIEKTAFVANNDHYEYVRMPFGLKNAPSTFQKVMDNVLREYLHKFCFVYMDDVVIFSKSLHEHYLVHIRQIFQKLEEYNLKVQLDKSEFLWKEVGFLGHVIMPDGIKLNQSKIQALQKYPLLKAIKEIRAFLALVGYYRRFIRNFARIKENMVADALSRIEINTKEKVSNYDGADLLSVLANADLEDLTPDDCDEILAQNIVNPNESDNSEEQDSSGASSSQTVALAVDRKPIVTSAPLAKSCSPACRSFPRLRRGRGLCRLDSSSTTAFLNQYRFMSLVFSFLANVRTTLTQKAFAQ